VRQNDTDTDTDPDSDYDLEPDLSLVRALHALAAVGLLGAGVVWLLHYPLRPPCPGGYVHFDLGIPAAAGGLFLALGARQAWRVRTPTGHGIVAAGLALVAMVAGVLGLEALHYELTHRAWDCWTLF
jgi:hypothetical protein